MTVQELIEKLSKFEPDVEVSIVFDGADRMNVEKVWLSNSGRVLLCDDNHTIYHDDDRPVGAPTEAQEKYWSTSDA